jgi:hypothetical protein
MPQAHRKPTDIVSPNLRIREELRRRLEQEAKRRAVSLNAEMARRLEHSFELDAMRSLDGIAERMIAALRDRETA